MVTRTEHDEKRGLFHGWANFEKPERDGDDFVGSFRTTNAVVELENGSILCVVPGAIRFLDTLELFEQYDWRGSEE